MELVEIIWVVLGLLLILGELLLGGFVIVFFGTSALVTGVALWFGFPGGHGLPFLLFSALTILQIVALRGQFKRIFRGDIAENGQPEDDDFTGRAATAASDFGLERDATGTYHGRIAFRGTQWSASCSEPAQPGQRVKIVRREGSSLVITLD
ncbi:MAG: NfeD family protein [Verrucomicrobiota bacterium JB022]|nr:NfeD family protein [Verrucomicrobiota bacterium JB022]